MTFLTEIMADAMAIVYEKSQDFRIQTAGGDLFDRAILVRNTQSIVSAYTDRLIHQNASDNIEQRFAAAFERYRNEFNAEEQKTEEDSIRESFIRIYSEPIADYLLTQLGGDSAEISKLAKLIRQQTNTTAKLNKLAAPDFEVEIVAVIVYGTVFLLVSGQIQDKNSMKGVALLFAILFLFLIIATGNLYSYFPKWRTEAILKKLDKEDSIKPVKNKILDNIEVRFPRANTEDFSNSTSFSAAVARASLTTSTLETSPAQFLASCFNIEEIHRLFQENHHLPTEIVRIILALALPEHFWTALYSIIAPIQNHHNLEFTIDIGVREARDGENKEDKEEEEEEPESDSDGDNDPDEKKSELSDDDMSATPKDPKKKKND